MMVVVVVVHGGGGGGITCTVIMPFSAAETLCIKYVYSHNLHVQPIWISHWQTEHIVFAWNKCLHEITALDIKLLHIHVYENGHVGHT